MQEETGFSPEEAPLSAGWRLVVEGQKVACMQERSLALTAEDACARAAKFIAADPEPELARLHAVRGVEDVDARGCRIHPDVFAGRVFECVDLITRASYPVG